MRPQYKNFIIRTLGCKVNQYESQAMREIMLEAGFTESPSKDMADICILNTCTVTQRADKESRHWIGLFNRRNPKARIVVTGCYVEKDSGDIFSLPGVSYILKNNEKNRIAEILTNDSRSTIHEPLSITDFKNHSKAFIKIQDGCENFCSYCKVPLVRGVLASKPIDLILKEIRGLVQNGFREIVLTGICLGAWGIDLFPRQLAQDLSLEGAGLVDVLKAIDKIPGNFRIRLSSIEPKYVDDELIDFIANNKRMCRHLHIPLQSGDDEILKRMNRPYTAASYKDLVNRIRSKIKDIAITTDVMVGFPGESDLNFKNTVNFIKDIIPSRTHIFTFSRRRDTAAYDMGAACKYDALKKRYLELNVAAIESSYLYRRNFLNETLNVLVETKRDAHSKLLTGYSDNYIKVFFEGPDDLMKRIVPVKIEDVNLKHTLGAYGKK